MEKLEKLQIVQDLKEIMDEKGYNQKELANEIGIGSGSLNHLFNKANEDWIGTNKRALVGEDIWNKCKAFIGVLRPSSWVFFPTQNALIVTGVCKRATIEKGIYTIIGPTGSGKTSTFSRLKSPTTYLVECVKYKRKEKQFFKQLAQAMNLSTSGTLEAIIERIIDKIKKTDDCLIIIDEANKLEAAVFPNIHGIYNELKKVGFQLALIFAGTQELSNLIDKRAVNNRMGFAEFQGRIKEEIEIKNPTKAELSKIVEAQGITNKNIIQMIANNSNHFRNVEMHIENLRFQAKGGQITEDLVQTYFE